MIGGDNRGEHCLARPRMQVVRIAHCSPGGCTRCGWVTRASSPHIFRKKHTSIVRSMMHTSRSVGDITLRYGSTLKRPSSSAGGMRGPHLPANQEQRNLFHAVEQGSGLHLYWWRSCYPAAGKTSPSGQCRVCGFALLARTDG